jgi:hypothetical protein
VVAAVARVPVLQRPEAQLWRRWMVTRQAALQMEKPQRQAAPRSRVLQKARKMERPLPKAQDSTARELSAPQAAMLVLELMTCSCIL